MKRAVTALLVIAVLAALGWWGSERLRKPAAPGAEPKAASATKTQPPIELAAGDVITVQPRPLQQGVALSGTLKSTATAMVKAKVAGELRELALREGDRVRAGQVVARIDPAEYEARLRQAQQQASAARAQIDIAQRQYDNNKALVDQGFISRTALDASLSNLQAARASHEAALAAQDVARKALDDTVLRAPLDGVVAQRLANNGERMAIDARVLEIVDPQRLELEATITAAESVAVRVGQAASLQLEGLAQPLKARVARINPSLQAGSRSVLVYLTLPPAEGLSQGLFAQGMLDTARASVLAVPLSSLRTDKPQPYVQVVTELNGQWQVAHRTVQPATRGREAAADADATVWVEAQGLREGERVLRGSVGALREGTLVKLPAARP
ncbi:MAG: efflux RND transporter periplasmic adaptor subunit [Burkholderiaceae bacterium]